MMVGKPRAKDRWRIDTTRAPPIPIDFLQRDDVGGFDFFRDSRQIIPAVFSEPELDIIGGELHRDTATARAL